MFRIYAISCMMLILAACQTTRSSGAIDKSELVKLSCDILKESQVKPTQSEWDNLGAITRQQIKTNPAMQKKINCQDMS